MIGGMAYIHDGSFEGLLTCVFEAFARKEFPEDIVSERSYRPRLDQAAMTIGTDGQKAHRVRAGLVRTCGKATFDAVLYAFLSDDPEAGACILRFVRYAMRRGRGALFDSGVTEVDAFMQIVHAVRRERHRMIEFIRFFQVEGGVFCATCSPKANVVPILMDWFSARFNTQPFLIFDRGHSIAGVYDGAGWRLVETDHVNLPPETQEEKIMAAAWKTFYDALAIDSRYNPELRRQLVPKRFWSDMTEMEDEWERKRMRGRK